MDKKDSEMLSKLVPIVITMTDDDKFDFLDEFGDYLSSFSYINLLIAYNSVECKERYINVLKNQRGEYLINYLYSLGVDTNMTIDDSVIYFIQSIFKLIETIDDSVVKNDCLIKTLKYIIPNINHVIGRKCFDYKFYNHYITSLNSVLNSFEVDDIKVVLDNVLDSIDVDTKLSFDKAIYSRGILNSESDGVQISMKDIAMNNLAFYDTLISKKMYNEKGLYFLTIDVLNALYIIEDDGLTEKMFRDNYNLFGKYVNYFIVCIVNDDRRLKLFNEFDNIAFNLKGYVDVFTAIKDKSKYEEIYGKYCDKLSFDDKINIASSQNDRELADILFNDNFTNMVDLINKGAASVNVNVPLFRLLNLFDLDKQISIIDMYSKYLPDEFYFKVLPMMADVEYKRQFIENNLWPIRGRMRSKKRVLN